MGKKIRIAIDMRWISMDTGGIRQYTLNLVEQLLKVDLENEYVLLFDRNDLKKEFELKCGLNGKKNIFCCLLSYKPYSLLNQIFLPMFLLRQKINIFHSPFFIIPLLLFGCKTVVTVHDLIPYLYPQLCPQKRTTKYRYLYRFFLSLIFKKADKIITCSKASHYDIIKEFGAVNKKINVVYNGVGEEFYPRKEVNLSFVLPDKKKILYVGRQDPSKNIATLIKAFAKIVNDKKADCCLVVVGKKDSRYSEIYNLVDDLDVKNDVIFTGYIPAKDLPLFYNTADLFVFPSLYEGFGLPPLEAMASGVPVISSNTSSLPEVVGDAGIMVGPYDIDALTKAMTEVLVNGNLRDKMIKKGLNQAKFFSWKKTAQEIRIIYETMV